MFAPVEINYLKCTLEECYVGNIEKKLESGGKVIIQKGWGKCTTAIVQHKKTKIHVIVQELPHERFQRRNQHLVYFHHTSLKNFLLAETINVTHLDGKVLTVSKKNIVQDGMYQKFIQVPQKGMPIPDSDSYGDLLIYFDIKYPYFTEKQKEIIAQTL